MPNQLSLQYKSFRLRAKKSRITGNWVVAIWEAPNIDYKIPPEQMPILQLFDLPDLETLEGVNQMKKQFKDVVNHRLH